VKTAVNAADIIAARLAAAGVRHAFGIPGGEVLALVDALERAGIRFVLTKHENAAGFMAEGGWHATAAPGVLVATVGPGIANAFNVTENARQDRVPLLVLAGSIDAGEALSYNHQVFDHRAVFARCCKASFTAEHGAVDVMIDKAVGIALSGRPGPVHIDLPIGLAERDQPAPRPWRHGPPLPTAPAPGEALERAGALFAGAERPVMMAGLDVLNEPGGAEAIRAFVERHGVPLLTSYKAKGVLPEDHPLSLGGHGLSPKADRIVLPVFEAADCIIAAGYDPIEMRTAWQNPWDPAKVIEFAHAPNDHDMHHAGLSWVCSVAGGLAALDGPPRPRWPRGEAAAIRDACWQAFGAGDGWGPAQAIAEMLAVAPPEATITIDSGAHRILLSQQWRAQHPRAILQSTGLCTMGCSLPLAMGFKHAKPQASVIAFTGDAGLEMVLGELGTLRDLALPLVIVVFVDRSLALIELKQRRTGLQNAGVDFGRTDFAGLARLYGGHGVTARGPGEAGPALAEALAADRFAILEIELPRRAYDGLF
jgi:acetolactate synthase-1/2/3 large subunit